MSSGPTFAAPPAPQRTGSCPLRLGPDAVFDAILEGCAISLAAIAAAACASGPARVEPPVITAFAIAFGVLWAWLVIARVPAKAQIAWDAHGICYDAGARIAIPWAEARMCAVRSNGHRIVQIRDAEGRSIVCATGRGLPRWVRGQPVWAEERDYAALLAALQLQSVPRVDTIEPGSSSLAGAPLAPVASALAAMSAFAAQVQLQGRMQSLVTLGLAATVGVVAVLPALAEAIAAMRRRHALAGTPSVTPIAPAGEPLRLQGTDGDARDVEFGELVGDARAGERAGTMPAVVFAHGGQTPYRTHPKVHVRGLESPGERRARRRRLAAGLARVGVAAGAAALAGVALATVPPPRERPAFERPESLQLPPPPPPGAWQHDPREPEPPPMDSIVQRGCDANGCRPRRYLIDERGRVVYACDQQAAAPCSAEYRARRAAAQRGGPPVPEPVVLPDSPIHRPTLRVPEVSTRFDCASGRCVPVVIQQTPDGVREIRCEGQDLDTCRELMRR
jgi:hypothetical protein